MPCVRTGNTFAGSASSDPFLMVQMKTMGLLHLSLRTPRTRSYLHACHPTRSYPGAHHLGTALLCHGLILNPQLSLFPAYVDTVSKFTQTCCSRTQLTQKLRLCIYSIEFCSMRLEGKHHKLGIEDINHEICTEQQAVNGRPCCHCCAPKCARDPEQNSY